MVGVRGKGHSVVSFFNGSVRVGGMDCVRRCDIIDTLGNRGCQLPSRSDVLVTAATASLSPLGITHLV